MSRFVRIAGAMLLVTLPAPLVAQEAPANPEATQASATAPEAVPDCKPKKKKKGFGLGSILKAASKTGLTNMVGGGLLGQGGAIASTAINTGVSIAESAPPTPKPEETHC